MRSVRFSWRLVTIFVAVVSGVLAPPSASADSTALHEAVKRSAEAPPDPAEVLANSRERLASSIQELEQFLAKGRPDKARGWSEWLLLDQIKLEATRTRPDLETMRSAHDRFYQNHVGLELPAFVNARKELRRYIIAAEYAAAPFPQELFRRRLEELAGCLYRLDAGENGDAAQQASSIVAWLEPLSEETARLAADVRKRYGRWNGLAQASGRLVNHLLAQKVEERTLISDVIMGAFTQGVAFTRGHVSFDVVPSDQYGTLAIQLQGQTASPANVAQRRNVSVLSSANITTTANKPVRINDEGFHMAPAAASASTRAQIRNVSARSRFVERIASRRVSRMLPEVESMTSRRAEAQAGSSLDRQADAAFSGMNDVFCDQIRAPLIRLNALPAKWRFWSDDDHLRVAVVQHNHDQLAAASPAPRLSARHDLATAFHESMIVNISEPLLGGRRIHDQDWLNLMNLLTGTPPRPLWVHDRAERWSVSFVKQQPITARFYDNRMQLTLRLSSVNRGATTFQHPVEIGVRFAPQTTDEGPALVRDGELSIRISEDAEPNQAAAMQAFLLRKFGAVFPPELHFTGLVPPAGGLIGKLRHLQVAQFVAADGWVTLAYELVGQGGPTALVDSRSSSASVR
jgi:hypothetical protein